MAGLQMVIWAFVQYLVQLKRDYPEDWETFISNSESVTFFNVMDQFTAKYFSEMLGTSTVELVSEQTTNLRIAQKNPNLMYLDDKIMARDLMQPSELRTMRDELGIMLHRGHPIRFEKITYYKNDIFCMRARHSPRHPVSKETMEQLKRELFTRMVPDEKKATSLLEKSLGYKVEKKSKMFGSDKIEVVKPNNGGSQTFDDPAAFLSWARQELMDRTNLDS